MGEEIVNVAVMPDVLDSIRQILHSHTVAFADVGEPERGRMPCLIGSGTLVRVGQRRAILTAYHVLTALPETGRLCLVLEKTREPHTLDRAGVAFLKIAHGVGDESIGPDLGALLLAEPLGGALEMKKSFYNLDKRKDLALHNPPDMDVGAWAVQGFLHERTVLTLDADGRGSTTGFYNFTAFGRPHLPFKLAEHDCFDLRGDEREDLPRGWGGMSGGGLWQVPLRRDGKAIVPAECLFSGVAFYQHPTTDTLYGIRCHGRRSVFQVAYDALRGGHA